VKVVRQPTSDQSLDNLVLDQDPPPNAQAEPGATVTIFVGRFQETTTSEVP
jgi:beta-lactam-binding protein with PASTA domain